MKILVTGGAGFIGSNFIHYMLKEHSDVEIINYDKLTYAGNLNNLKGIDQKRYTFIKGDVCDYEKFKGVISSRSPSAVIHFAAESHVDKSLDSPQEFINTNILGTEAVLRAIRDCRIPKLVHISTDEVYGSLSGDDEAAEDYPFKPNSPYSASKTSADVFCRAYHVTHGVPVVVLRGSNCYGARQYPEKLIPLSLTNLLTGKKIGIYGSGINVREWIYTEDFCRGVEAAVLRGIVGEAYNLGGGRDNRVTNLDIAGELLRLLDRTDDDLEFIEDRRGHDLRYAINSNKLRNELSWSPKLDLSKGLEKTVEWYQKNEWWWKPLL